MFYQFTSLVILPEVNISHRSSLTIRRRPLIVQCTGLVMVWSKRVMNDSIRCVGCALEVELPRRSGLHTRIESRISI